MHKKVRSQEKKDFWNNINFLILHVCLGLNTLETSQAETGTRAGLQNRKEEPGVRESKNLELKKKKKGKIENISFVFSFQR